MKNLMLQIVGWLGIGIIVLLGAGPEPVWAQTPCDPATSRLGEIQTRHQLRNFVDCASAHIDEVGWVQAQTDFQTPGRWLDGSMFLFAGYETGELIFSAGADTPIGVSLVDLQDEDGYFIVAEIQRIVREYGAGYVYYKYPNPATDMVAPKETYVKKRTVGDETIILGAGIYPLATPGTCSPEHVRASLVHTEQDLERFVNCAEYALQQQGLMALHAFNTDPRWTAGPTYLFLLDMAMLHVIVHGGNHDLIGTDLSELVDPHGVKITQEMQRILSQASDGYVYYGFTNPATGAVEPKASFVKQVYHNGHPYILGAGLYIPSPECRSLPANARDVDTAEELELFVTCAHALLEERGEWAYDLFAHHPQWIGGETYIFVLDDLCRTVVYGQEYRADELDNCDMEDEQGTRVTQMMKDIANSEEGIGWLTYVWNNPATDTVETKTSYVMGVGVNDAVYTVGAGIYTSEE